MNLSENDTQNSSNDSTSLMLITPLQNIASTCWLNTICQSIVCLHSSIPIQQTIQEDVHQPLHQILVAFMQSNAEQRTQVLFHLVRYLSQFYQIGLHHDVLEVFLFLIDKLISEEEKLEMTKEEVNELEPSLQQWVKEQKYHCSRIYAQFYTQYMYTCSDGDMIWQSSCAFILDDHPHMDHIRISSYFQQYLQSHKQQLSRPAPIMLFSLNNICKQTNKSILWEFSLCFANDTKYQLKSMIFHHGNEHGGHYTCIVRHSHECVLCDDMNIQPISLGETCNTIPTLLIYEKET